MVKLKLPYPQIKISNLKDPTLTHMYMKVSVNGNASLWMFLKWAHQSDGQRHDCMTVCITSFRGV